MRLFTDFFDLLDGQCIEQSMIRKLVRKISVDIDLLIGEVYENNCSPT